MTRHSKYFLPYQQRWLADTSRIKIWEKSRRIGATYVQSYEDVRDCAAKAVPKVWFSSADESAAREYIEYCEKWAKLYHLAAQNMGLVLLELPEKKFLLPRYNATYDNPYGERVLSRCFWPVTFKKGGLKFWLRFIEKFGSAWIIGKHSPQADKTEIDDLADKLERAIQDAVLVIPEGSSAEIVEAAGKAGSSSLYKDLKATCDEDISICILGQNLTTSVHGGSLAAAEVHERVRREIKDGDKHIVLETMATLIDWICALNFGPGDARPVFELFEEEEVDQKLATRDKTLSDTGQVKFSKRYFMKAYDLEEEDFEVVAGAPTGDTPDPKPADFAQAPAQTDSDPIDAMAAVLTPEMLQDIAGQLLAPVLDLVESAGSVEAIAERLHGVYPDMDDATFTDLLTRAVFVASLWGRLSAQAEGKEA